MIDNIPIEIQMEIVKRVPVKSLFRFRSVSKSWKSVIDSHQFTADYNACESRPQHLLIRYNEEAYTRCMVNFDRKYVCIVDDDIFPQHKFFTRVPMAVSFEYMFTASMELIMVGSSQGLFCLYRESRYGGYSFEGVAFIWNPAIKKSIAIGVPMLKMSPTILGFGVCPNTNEPMLVKINNGLKDVPQKIEVFTLSSRIWRSSRGSVPRKSVRYKQSQVAIDGFIYWLTYDGFIVSFDMTSEEFAEINLPRCLVLTYSKCLSISKLRESLVVLEHYMEAEKPVCDVWMMEHGVPNSFTKLYTVTIPNACLIKVLGFRKNGEAILEAKTDQAYVSAVLEVYEPHSRVIKDLGIHGRHHSFFVTSYKETLLLHDQPDDQRIKIELV